MNNPGWFIVDHAWLWTSILGIALGTLVFWFAMQRSDLAPLLVMATVPVQRELLAGADGYFLTYTQICIAGFFAGALIRFLSGRLQIRFDPLVLTLAAVGCFYGISIVTTGGIRNWAGETYRWLIPVLFFAVARSFFGHQTLKRLPWLIGAMIGAAAVWSAIQVGNEAGPTSFARNGWTRTFGGFGEPNPFAAHLVAIALVATAFAFSAWFAPRRIWVALISATVALSGIGAVVATQSRGGLLGLTVGIGLLIWVFGIRAGSRSSRLTVGAGTLGAIVLILVVAVAAPWNSLSQEVTIANWAERERTAHWRTAWAMITTHPWFGVGAGSFADSFRTYTTEWRFRISRGHAHNAYLQMAAEVGIPALCAYLAFLSLLVAKLIRCLRQSSGVWLPAGALAVTIAMNVHQMFDYLNVLSLGIVYSGIWAAALAIAQRNLKTGEHHVAI